ncbi:MAG: hypothetical protein AMXMBFR26_11970 [Porticoccaceae bacterium]
MRRSGSGYPTAILISLLLHGGVIALLVSGWHPEFKPRQLPQSTYMEAALLQMDAPPPPGRKQAKPAPPSPPRPDPAEIQRQQQAARDKAAAAQAAKEQAAAKAAQQKAAQQKVAQEKAAAEKAAAEKVAREKMAREKVAADKAAAEKAAKEKAAKEKAAKEQAAKDKAAREQAAREKAARDKAAQEKAAQAKAAAEQAARDKAAAEQAAAVQGQMIATYGDYVRDRIISNWNRPPSARRDMEAVLQVRLVPTGQVMGVSVIRSSGDPAFDQSAVNAVQQVGRFERLQELSRKDPLLFERTFRTLTLTFRPEDLRL